MIVDRRQMRDKLAAPAHAADAAAGARVLIPRRVDQRDGPPRARRRSAPQCSGEPSADARRLARLPRAAAPEDDRAGAGARARGRRAPGAALHCPVITVGGTNGKGSTCAMLESILRAAGYRVGLYTSPHLLRYNERVRIDGREVDDDALVAAFAAVEARARATGTAADLLRVRHAGGAAGCSRAPRLDAVMLEVGLGGRLDAVNIVDADCRGRHQRRPRPHGVPRRRRARRSAARRPASSAPAGPAVVRRRRAAGDRCSSTRGEIGAPLLLHRARFRLRAPSGTQWQYWGPGGTPRGLRYPALRGDVSARATRPTAIAALDALRDRLPVAAAGAPRGLLAVELPGASRCCPAGRGDPRRRRTTRRRRARWRRTLGSDGLPPAQPGGVRHAARQGHRRRRRRAARPDRSLARRDAAGPARRERGELRAALVAAGVARRGDRRASTTWRAALAAAQGEARRS